MKARNALIAWTPNDESHPADHRGKITVRAFPCVEPIKPEHSRTGGAAYVAVRQMTGLMSELRLFVEFHTLVVRDGIDPRKAHDAFMAIDEYRKLIAPDT